MKVTKPKRSKHYGERVNSEDLSMVNLHDKSHTSMILSSAGEYYHLLVANDVFDRRMLLFFTKGKNKKKMECDGKGITHNKKVDQRLFVKLARGCISHQKQFVTGKGFKFKRKHGKPKKFIKERLSCIHNACLWNSKLEHELFRKKQKARYKRRNKTEYIHMLSELLLKEVAKKSKVFKGLGYVLMHENHIMRLASWMIEVKHSGFEGLYKVNSVNLGDKVGKFIVLDHVVHSAGCLAGEYSWTDDMERIIKVRTLGDSIIIGYMYMKKTMEVIPKDLIMNELRERADINKSDKSVKSVKELVLFPLKTALLTSGFSHEESSTFRSRIHMILKLDLSFDDKQKENRRIQMLQPVKQLSELCVSAVLAAIQLEETYTEADMVQEHQGFDKAWQKGRDDSTLASDGLLQLLQHLTNLDCTWEWQGSMENQFFQYDLEDKVSFNGAGIDTCIRERPNMQAQEERIMSD